MRHISTRFALLVGAFALAFSGFLLYRTWSVTRHKMESFVAHESELTLKFDLAIREYVRECIRPEIERRLKPGEFVPEAMSSSFVARSIFEKVQSQLPDYIIKFSSENPRNPMNQAGPEEIKMIRYFRDHPEVSRWSGEIGIDGKPYFAQLSAMRMDRTCMECHGRPEDAPAQLVARYGSTAGFGYQLGDVAGLDAIAIPLEKVEEASRAEASTQLAITAVWLVALFAFIFVAFRLLVGRRLAALAAHFQASAAQCDGSVPSVPVLGKDEIGVLATSYNALAERVRGFHASLENLVAQRTAALEAEILERQKTQEALETEQRILRQLLAIHERHQKMIAGEIHESLTQPLAGALMNLDGSLGKLKHDGNGQFLAALEQARELLAETIDRSRRLMTGLRPTILDDLGPIAAIESLVAECEVLGNLQVEATLDVQFDRLDPELETAIFRIVEECLRNARRHSRTERIRLSLVQCGERLWIEVQDWGVGFDPRTRSADAFGLESVTERCRLLGGSATVTSSPGQGTLLQIELPLRPAPEPVDDDPA